MINLNVTYTQVFTGQLNCYAVPGTAHCGRVHGNQLFPITVSIHYPPNVELDSNGFLLDNLWFELYCESFKDTHLKISCEHLAWLVASDCLEADQRIVSVLVDIEGVRGTSLQLLARRADRIPASLAESPTSMDM